MSIESKLKAWGKSKSFQDAVGRYIASGGRGSGGEGSESFGVKSNQEAERKLLSIKNNIEDLIVLEVPGMKPDMFNIFGPYKDVRGNLRYVLKFKPASVHRSSLYPEGYPDGLENIVALYSHGSKPSRHSVWNRAAGWEWNYRTNLKRGERRMIGHYREGKHYYIKAGTFVEANPFLRNYIDALNKAYAQDNIRIELHDKYYP